MQTVLVSMRDPLALTVGIAARLAAAAAILAMVWALVAWAW
jgi:hypothetical protein